MNLNQSKLDACAQRMGSIRSRMDAFEEGDHPRGADGKFGSGGNSPEQDEFFQKAKSAIGKNGKSTPALGKVLAEYGKFNYSKLEPKEREALTEYQGLGAYEGMNKFLNGKSDGDARTKQLVDSLQSAVLKSKVPVTVPVQRSLRVTAQELTGLSDLSDASGKEFTHKGFVSSTRKEQSGYSVGAKTILKFTAHAGSPGLVTKGGQEGGEEEMIFPAGSVFKISKIENVGNQQHVYASIVGHKDTPK